MGVRIIIYTGTVGPRYLAPSLWKLLLPTAVFHPSARTPCTCFLSLIAQFSFADKFWNHSRDPGRGVNCDQVGC